MSFPIKTGDFDVRQSSKSKLIVDPVLFITLTIVLCGIVYIFYTVRTFDLAQKRLELTRETQILAEAQMKLAAKQQKLVEDQWAHAKEGSFWGNLK
jgi:hypothetical protein